MWNIVNKDCFFEVLGVTKSNEFTGNGTLLVVYTSTTNCLQNWRVQSKDKQRLLFFPRPSSHDIAHFRKLQCCDLEKTLTM